MYCRVSTLQGIETLEIRVYMCVQNQRKESSVHDFVQSIALPVLKCSAYQDSYETHEYVTVAHENMTVTHEKSCP